MCATYYGPQNPYGIPGYAARYSMEGATSDSTYIINGSNQIQLIADRSANSTANGYVNQGATSNYAEAPSISAYNFAGDYEIIAKVAATTYDSTYMLVNRDLQGGQRFFQLALDNTGAGRISFTAWRSGSAKSFLSTADTGAADYETVWLKVTVDVDNGAGGTDVIFYKSPDGSTWTKIGATVTVAGTGALDSGSCPLRIGLLGNNTQPWSGSIYRVILNNGIDGTAVFDSNFTLAGKLATSFTESSSNAATVTINTSGDTGARICGARDLVQMTAASRPIFSMGADSKNIATSNGTSQYMKAAPFVLSQPESIYLVFSQETFTANDLFFDGNTVDSVILYQKTSAPSIATYAGTVAAIETSALPLATRGVARCIFNGASSSLGINQGAATTANIGVGNSSGFTLFARAGGTQLANMTFSETLLRSAADSDYIALRIAAYLMAKWGISF